jgi:hypothetical protein
VQAAITDQPLSKGVPGEEGVKVRSAIEKPKEITFSGIPKSDDHEAAGWEHTRAGRNSGRAWLRPSGRPGGRVSLRFAVSPNAALANPLWCRPTVTPPWQTLFGVCQGISLALRGTPVFFRLNDCTDRKSARDRGPENLFEFANSSPTGSVRDGAPGGRLRVVTSACQ